ncbi:MAG: CBS domain-containing protein [candidate division Zixibacteria bacterium]|nr:CBS domain-containing protein [candidate division Zixibacteria bacterium]
MLVKALLKNKPREVVTANSSTLIDEAMELLISNKIGCLPVVEDSGKLIGIISDKDIFKKVHETKGDFHSLKVSDIMATDLIIGLPDDEINYIAGVMDKNWIRHVPIVDGERVIGLISLRDIVKEQAKKMEIENRYLDLYMNMRKDKSGDI